MTNNTRSSNIFVAANIGPLLVNCLVDTGAAYSLCSESIVPSNTVISPSSIELKGVTGTPLNISGTVTLPMIFGTAQKSVQLFVSPGIKHQIILGRDFMSATDCEISFEKLTLSMDDCYDPRVFGPYVKV